MKNQAECYKALLDGEALISVNFVKVKLKEGAIIKIDDGSLFQDVFINPNIWQIYNEPKWYNNIPEGGVLCWCSFGGSDKKYTDIIKRYGSKKEKFITDYNEYAKAEPLTKQEIQTYLDNAPEE